MSGTKRQYGIIAGSGFASFGDGADGVQVATRFGPPSSAVRELAYDDHSVHVILRHGERHDLAPHAINYPANLEALKMRGVDSVIALNTVGVIRAGIEPGQLAIPTQLIDYSWGRHHSIYAEPCASLEHVDMTEPLTPALRQALLAAATRAEAACHDGGVYAVTQGPRLETAAEVDRIERDGGDYIGMTAMPEAGIARELGMDYACISLVVNYAAGRGEQAIHEDIEECTMTAKMQAMRVLRAFFEAPGH